MTSQVFASLTSTNYSPKPGLLKSCNGETCFQSMKESGSAVILSHTKFKRYRQSY